MRVEIRERRERWGEEKGKGRKGQERRGGKETSRVNESRSRRGGLCEHFISIIVLLRARVSVPVFQSRRSELIYQFLMTAFCSASDIKASISPPDSTVRWSTSGIVYSSLVHQIRITRFPRLIYSTLLTLTLYLHYIPPHPPIRLCSRHIRTVRAHKAQFRIEIRACLNTNDLRFRLRERLWHHLNIAELEILARCVGVWNFVSYRANSGISIGWPLNLLHSIITLSVCVKFGSPTLYQHGSVTQLPSPGLN